MRVELVVIRAPVDREHSYRVRFPDGSEASLRQHELDLLARSLEGWAAGLRLAAIERNGEHLKLWEERASINWPRLSPDGRRLVYQRFYSELLGWQFTTMDGFDDTWLYRSGPGELGA